MALRRNLKTPILLKDPVCLSEIQNCTSVYFSILDRCHSTCKDDHQDVAEEDDGVCGVAEVASVLPELLQCRIEVAELDPLPRLSLPLGGREAQGEVKAE